MLNSSSPLRGNAFALLSIVLGGLAASAAFTQEPPPAKVEVEVAQLREMARAVTVSGTVVSLNDSRIAAEIQGVLLWLAEVGTQVAEGDTIARIDPRLLRIAHDRARANVARLEVDHAFRERELKRTEELAQRNSVSETRLDEVRAARDQLAYQLDDARAFLEQTRGDLERTDIRAAFAGHVTERLASLGEFIDVGEDILRLVDTQRMEISLPVPIALSPFIRPGLAVAVDSNGTVREHEVRTLVPVGDAVSRMVEVRLSVAEGDWLVGTPVQVSLPASRATLSVAVPRDALVERGGRAFVYKIDEAGTAVQVSADAGLTVGLWVAITEGVEAGDRIIVRGAERLSPGQPVEVISGDAVRS